jgi:phytanoyl-CoA hydroxylase
MIDISQYNEKGFILIKGIIPKQEIQDILCDAKRVFFEQFKYKKYTSVLSCDALPEKDFNECLYRLFTEDFICLSNCGKQVQHLISLHRLSLSDIILCLLKEVGLKKPIISTRPVLYFNHPNLAKKKVFHQIDAHQDWRSMQGSLNSAVIWVPLIDINKSLGALRILPKSHKDGLRTELLEQGFGMVSLTESERQHLLDVEVTQGDLLIFSSFLIHQSGENVTEGPRWSCHFRYNDLMEESFICRAYAHPYLYKPQEELITPNFPLKSDLDYTFKI